ncbi:MAG: hypothetical protein ACOCQ5_01605 [Halanaerobiales bacterium]
MKKAVVRNKKKMDIMEAPVPEIGPEEILIKVKACGICSSEVHGEWMHGGNYPVETYGHEVIKF